MTQSNRDITIFHSPDADDAFMFYGLASGKVSVPGYTFNHELCDIETLNQRAVAGQIDCTAVSVHSYPFLHNQFVILNCGASMGGQDYGPRLVALTEIDIHDGKFRRIAIPGKLTSASLALQLYLKDKGIIAELVPIDFDKVQESIKNGVVDAGVIIHEGQLTAKRDGFKILLDLGKWWWEEHNLPLPLGVNVVNKKLGSAAIAAVAQALKGSIECALSSRTEALEYALQYGRGLSHEDADTFVGMYVNNYTLDLGEDGRRSINLFLQKGAEYGIISQDVSTEFFLGV